MTQAIKDALAEADAETLTLEERLRQAIGEAPGYLMTDGEYQQEQEARAAFRAVPGLRESA